MTNGLSVEKLTETKKATKHQLEVQCGFQIFTLVSPNEMGLVRINDVGAGQQQIRRSPEVPKSWAQEFQRPLRQ